MLEDLPERVMSHCRDQTKHPLLASCVMVTSLCLLRHRLSLAGDRNTDEGSHDLRGRREVGKKGRGGKEIVTGKEAMIGDRGFRGPRYVARTGVGG